MGAGRPTKYNKDTIQKALEYIQNHKDYGDPVPIAAGLACELGVSKSTIYKWAGEHKLFSDTLDLLQSKQERMLAGGALEGELQATIAKLMLANHGYSDKQEIKQETYTEQYNLSKEEREQRIKELEARRRVDRA